jgi:hypothetical protein
MEALASCCFQVEELARLHYPNGILIEYSIDTANYCKSSAKSVLI